MNGEMELDPKRVVEEGWDRIGERYAQVAASTQRVMDIRSRYVSALAARLPSGAKVLDLGCGSGIPTTRQLAEHFAVTGVDISSQQVERAKRNVPGASFIQGDMTALELPPGSFDAVTAFFSIFHLPRQEQPELLGSIARWLRPGGFFVGVMSGKDDEVDYVERWMGAPMFWSGYDSETNKGLVRESGLSIISSEEISDSDDSFLWLIAQKPVR